MAVKKHFGWRRQLPDKRDLRFVPAPQGVGEMPPAFSMVQPAVGPPFDPALDQSALGSCGPNALAGMLAYSETVRKTSSLRASRLFLYYVTRQLMGTLGYDSGVDNRTMLKALVQFGWPDENLWLYDISRYRSKPPQAAYDDAEKRRPGLKYLGVSQDAPTFKAALFQREPVLLGFTVYTSIDSDNVDSTGDIPLPGRFERVLGGHDVIATGWNDATRKIQIRNSWAGWGHEGYGTLPYDYVFDPDLAGDFWVLDAPTPAPTPAPPGPAAKTYLQVDKTLPAGTYILTPIDAAPGDVDKQLSPATILAIVQLVAAFMADPAKTPAKLVALLATIAMLIAAG